VFWLALWLALAPPVQAQSVANWRPFVVEAARRFGVPIAWIERVMQAESGGRTRLGGRPIVSRAGAMGLMQLMPATWADMRGRLGLGSDPFDPRDNILAGTCYLRLMYDRFGYPGLFGAYNAGPARYADYHAGRARLPGETRAYLASVSGGLSRQPDSTQSGPERAIFVALSSVPSATAARAAPLDLFVALHGTQVGADGAARPAGEAGR